MQFTLAAMSFLTGGDDATRQPLYSAAAQFDHKAKTCQILNFFKSKKSFLFPATVWNIFECEAQQFISKLGTEGFVKREITDKADYYYWIYFWLVLHFDITVHRVHHPDKIENIKKKTFLKSDCSHEGFETFPLF